MNRKHITRTVIAAAALVVAAGASAQVSMADMIKARQKVFGV